MISDKSQRQQALDTQQSFIVQAPAGSGKTALLTQRLLHLLLTVEKAPEEILAITFTRKAANEMRHRVISALRLANAEQPDDDYLTELWHVAKKVQTRSRQLGWDLCNNPNRLRILTIDAFCSRLIHQMPTLSQLGATPTISEDAHQLYQQAAEGIINSLEQKTAWQDALAKLCLHLDNNLPLLRRLFVSMLAHREQWLSHVVNARDNQSVKQQLEADLQQSICRDLHLAVRFLKPQFATELLELFNYAQENLTQPTLSQLPTEHIDALGQWQRLSQFLLTTQFSWRKTVNRRDGFPASSAGTSASEKAHYKAIKQRMLLFLAKLSQHDDLRQCLENIAHAPNPYYEQQQWQILTALLQLLPILVAELQVHFAQQKNIDFIELGQRALLALGDEQQPTDLALYIDYKIKHILIDEFQDTSISQFRLLEKLTSHWQNGDGRSLFLVGDPMQSIYRFRAAEVGLFLRAKKYGVGQIRLQSLVLNCNFRSSPDIVNWINTHFSQIFPKQDDIAQAAVSYHACSAVSSKASTGVLLYQHTDNSQAITISDIIKAQTKQASIAILVKSRRQLFEIIPHLRQQQIHYQAVDIETLDHLPYIQDLLNLSCALIQPADRLAWLSLLRSPYCGLLLNDLQQVVEQNLKATIWQNLSDPDVLEKLSDDGQQRIKPFIHAMHWGLAQRQRHCLRQWVYAVWLMLQGPATVKQQHDLVNVNAFFDLLQQLDNADQLLERQQLHDKLHTLYAQPTTNAKVKLMTIHKAKGLEFDVVIVPSLQQRTQADTDQLLAWLERPSEINNSELLLAPIKAKKHSADAIYQYVKRQQRQKAEHETARLLYVAATRAKHALHLLYELPQAQQNLETYKPTNGTFLAKLWPSCQDDFIDVAPRNINQQQITTPQLRRLSKNYQIPQALNRLLNRTRSQHHSLTTNYPQMTNSNEAIIGSVMHQILYQMSQLEQQQWPELAKKPWQKQLLYLGLEKQYLAKALQKITRLCQTVCNSQTARWILTKHDNAHSEYAIKHHDGSTIQHVIFDRIFDYQGETWLIDYKTGEYQITDYQQQLQNYRRILPRITPLPCRYALYFPLNDKLIEPDLDYADKF